MKGVIYSLRGMGMTDEAIRKKKDELKNYVMKLMNDILNESASK